MVEQSGGLAPNGVQHETESLDEAEAASIARWVEDLALRRKRAVNAGKIDS